MTLPTAVAICENGLSRDLEFLKSFARRHVDLRVTPVGGGTLGPKVARVLRGQVQSMTDNGLTVSAVVVHHDVDRRSLAARRQEVSDWFRSSGLGQLGCSLVVCAPDPCIERWLCLSFELPRPSRARPSDGCAPWKRTWEKGKGPDLSRVREAAARAHDRLNGEPDFSAFLDDWQKAGLARTPR
jgi:hypothetical protein